MGIVYLISVLSLIIAFILIKKTDKEIDIFLYKILYYYYQLKKLLNHYEDEIYGVSNCKCATCIRISVQLYAVWI